MKAKVVLFALMASLLVFVANKCEKEEETPPVTDIDLNTYETVTIGSQVWMKENLKVTKFNDGTSIPSLTEAYDWVYATGPGYCWYNNNEAANVQHMVHFITGVLQARANCVRQDGMCLPKQNGLKC